MNKLVMKAVGVLALFVMSSANALFVGDVNYIGYTVDGAPADEATEAGRISHLIDMAIGTTQNPCTVDQICSRAGSTLDTTGFDDAVVAGAMRMNDPEDDEVDVTGWTYLLVRFGGIAHVWYVGNLAGDQEYPEKSAVPYSKNSKKSKKSKTGVSHWTLFNPSVKVPEPGTLALLTIGLMGLGFARRKA